MPRKVEPTPFARSIVEALKQRVESADRRDDLALVHRIPVISPRGGASLVFTVEITRGRPGRFVATCHEFATLLVAGASEHEVLMHAELEITQWLKAGRPPPH